MAVVVSAALALVILAQFRDRQSRNRKTYRPFHCATCRERVPLWDRLLAAVGVDVGIRLVELGALLS
jgi:hypothetical protein